MEKKANNMPSEKSIYFWNMAGSVTNALSAVLILIVVTRILGTEKGDIFSIAWAIAQQMVTIGTFQVRLYQATDVKEVYTFRQYLIFRNITVVIMIISSAVYIAVKHYTGYKALIILLVCLYKAVDALSDVYQGWFQQKERLDLAGKCLTFKVVVSLVVFGVSLMVTKNLLIGCILMLVTAIVCFVLFDVRYKQLYFGGQHTKKETDKQWIRHMFMTCFPLFLNSFIVISIFNAPKMAIDSAMMKGTMETGAQTAYGILFMPASVINLIYIVFRPMITQMAIAWKNDNVSKFLKLISKISASLLVLSGIVMVGGGLLGIPLLSVLYSVDLHEHRNALLILLLGGGLNTLVNVLDNALTVIRKQYTLVIAYVLTWVYSLVVAPFFVNAKGIFGASLAFMTSMLLLLVIVFVLFVVAMKKETKNKTKQKKGEA